MKVRRIRCGSHHNPFHSQAFSASQWFNPNPHLRACFIPQPRPGFMPVQGLFPPRSILVSSTMIPPMPLFRSPSSNPEGPMAGQPDLDFEVLLRAKIRIRSLVLPAELTGPFCRFSLLQVLSSFDRAPDSSAASAPDLFCFRRSTGLQRLHSRRGGVIRRNDCRPARAFSPSN